MIVWIHQSATALAQQRRIRINCIAPCATDTAFMAATAELLGPAFIASYPYPLLGRMPTADEQAWSLLLLSSPLNAAVTGAVLATDQGYVGGLHHRRAHPGAIRSAAFRMILFARSKRL